MATRAALVIIAGIQSQIAAPDVLAVGAGVTTLAGNLTVTSAGGTTTLGDATLSVSGAATFTHAGTALTVNNNATVSGTLTTPAVDNNAGSLSFGANTTSTNIGKAATTTTVLGNLTVNGTFSATLALAGDVTGTTAASVVSAISGASPILITPNVLEWLATATAPRINQNLPTSDVACVGMIISSQSAFPTATINPTGGSLTLISGTPSGLGNGNSVPIIANIPSPTGSGVESGFIVQRGGTFAAQLGGRVGSGAVASALYLEPGIVPSASNYVLEQNNGGFVQLNAPSAGGMGLAINTVDVINVNATNVQFVQPIGGVSGTPLAVESNGAVAVGAGGTFALSAAQQALPRTPLTGNFSATSSVSITLPNAAGVWFFDVTGITPGANTLTFTSGSASSPAYTAATLPKGGLIVIVTNGTNTLASLP